MNRKQDNNDGDSWVPSYKYENPKNGHKQQIVSSYEIKAKSQHVKQYVITRRQHTKNNKNYTTINNST